MTRLFWANVAAVVLFGGLAAYQFVGEKFRPAVTEAQLLAPIETAEGDAQLRAKGESVARAAFAAHQKARSLNRALGVLALAASLICLWSATTLSELRETEDAARALALGDDDIDDDEEDL